MPILNLDINCNHIYFLLIILPLFSVRFLFGSFIFSSEDENANKRFFILVLCSFSNFFSGFCICISKIRSSKAKITNIKERKSQKILVELIFREEKDDLPVNLDKMLIRTLLLALSDIIAKFILILFFFFNQITFEKDANSLLIFRIIFTYLFSRIILKKLFYKHHYLSFIINLICLVFFFFYDYYNIKDDNNSKNTVLLYVLSNIISGFFYSFENVIGKKALIKDFLSPYSILMIKAIYEFILLIFIFIPFIFIKINDKNFFSYSYNKIKENFILILIAIFLNFLYNVFLWIIIDKFSADHVSMVMLIDGLTQTIISIISGGNKNFSEKITKIILHLILLVGALIHNEIIILNFCGLNENTAKEFKEKEKLDNQLLISLDDSISEIDEEKNEKIEIEISDKSEQNA